MTDLKSISDDAQQRVGSHMPPRRPHERIVEARRLPDAPAEILWLRVSFSTAFDAGGVERWHRRLHAFLSTCGLVAAISLERIAIFPVGQPVMAFDRGLIIGWLTAQPEVVFAQVDRFPAGMRAASTRQGGQHG